MIACDNTVTLIHHIKDDDDTYTCTVLHNASWFKKIGASTSKDGATPSNDYKCRIMTENDLVMEVDDYMVLGIVESYESREDIKIFDYFRIKNIGDNRRGNLKHWSVSGQ